MGFNWSERAKERYFKKARKQIREAGYQDFLKVRTDRFGICKGNAKVYLKPISRQGQTKKWWEAKRNMKNLKEQGSTSDCFGRKRRMIYIHGYLLIELEEKDK